MGKASKKKKNKNNNNRLPAGTTTPNPGSETQDITDEPVLEPAAVDAEDAIIQVCTAP